MRFVWALAVALTIVAALPAAAQVAGRPNTDVRGALADPAELERVLVHEYGPALLQTLAPRKLPSSLNEGVAVAFQPDGSAWIDAEMARATRRMPVQALTSGVRSLSAEDARQACVESGFLARALVDRIGPASVAALLRDLARGDRFTAAFEKHAGMPFASFLDGLAIPR